MRPAPRPQLAAEPGAVRFPRISDPPVSEVNSADVLEILTPIWHEKPETARAVRQRVRSVLEWAVASAFGSDPAI